MELKPHSPEWYDRLATLQRGYYYPWKSRLGRRNGEDEYLELVNEHLSPEQVVLDVGCGHGEVALSIAPRCRFVLAYDRVPAFLQLAVEARRRQGVENVTFLCADASAQASGGLPTLPVPDRACDLLISRRGPMHWIEDASRVARPGAVLIQLNPGDAPLPTWNERLPLALQLVPPSTWSRRQAVARRLSIGGLRLHSCWSFEVPELFDDSQQLYIKLAWGHTSDEVPPYADVQGLLEAIFREYAGPEGLEVPCARFLWKAVVP